MTDQLSFQASGSLTRTPGEELQITVSPWNCCEYLVTKILIVNIIVAAHEWTTCGLLSIALQATVWQPFLTFF